MGIIGYHRGGKPASLPFAEPLDHDVLIDQPLFQVPKLCTGWLGTPNAHDADAAKPLLCASVVRAEAGAEPSSAPSSSPVLPCPRSAHSRLSLSLPTERPRRSRRVRSAITSLTCWNVSTDSRASSHTDRASTIRERKRSSEFSVGVALPDARARAVLLGYARSRSDSRAVAKASASNKSHLFAIDSTLNSSTP